MSGSDQTVRVVVYGTLKRGFRNHFLVKPHLIFAKKVRFRAHLYHLDGYNCPAVLFPSFQLAKSDRFIGSGDYQSDFQMASSVNDIKEGSFPEIAGEWDLIEGEIFELSNQLCALAVLDKLEGFLIEGDLNYTRELIPVQLEEGWEYAWGYGMDKLPSQAERLFVDSWEEDFQSRG